LHHYDRSISFYYPREGWPEGNYTVEISGSGFEFAANEPAKWRLYSEDWIYDDRISWPHGEGTVSHDGTFFFSDNATGRNLDEDPEGKDEIYAIVSIGGLGSDAEYRSNNVSAHF
jgi:hypothetical protein